MFYAIPGIADFDNMNIFEGKNSLLNLGAAAFPWNESLSTESLITAFRLSRYSNMVKSNIYSEDEKSVIEKTESTKKLHTLIKNKKKAEVIEIQGIDEDMVRLFFTKIHT
jgi:hypothetical protein